MVPCRSCLFPIVVFIRCLGLVLVLDRDSFVHSVIYSFIQSFIHSFLHPVIRSFIRSFIHPVIHSSSHSFIHPVIHSFIQSFIHSSGHSFMHSFIQLFIDKFIRSFFCKLNFIGTKCFTNFHARKEKEITKIVQLETNLAYL